MQKLRTVHLYLGCIFAPMLLFFAISGIWQVTGFNSKFLRRLSSIHTMHYFKQKAGTSSGWGDLSSPAMRVFVLLMAISFILTTLLGVVLAIKMGRNRKAAYYCLGFGILAPVVLVLLRTLQ